MDALDAQADESDSKIIRDIEYLLNALYSLWGRKSFTKNIDIIKIVLNTKR